jgi:hypothetical protein
MQENSRNGEPVSVAGIVASITREINRPNNFILFNVPILRDYLSELLAITDRYIDGHPGHDFFGMNYAEFRQDLLQLIDNLQRGAEHIDKQVAVLTAFLGSELTRIEEDLGASPEAEPDAQPVR